MASGLPALDEVGVNLETLKKEALDIWKEELALKARQKFGKENVWSEMHRLMEREEKCFQAIRAARKILRSICGHPRKKWIGKDWFCPDCGNIQYAESRVEVSWS